MTNKNTVVKSVKRICIVVSLYT